MGGGGGCSFAVSFSTTQILLILSVQYFPFFYLGARGLEISKELVKKFNFHVFDHLSWDGKKIDPTLDSQSLKVDANISGIMVITFFVVVFECFIIGSYRCGIGTLNFINACVPQFPEFYF